MKRNITLILLIMLVPFLCITASATDDLVDDPVRVLEGRRAAPWQRIECRVDRNAHFQQEKFLSTTSHKRDPGEPDHHIAGAFGTPEPHSKKFLLHYGPGWSDAERSTPILLVHGAGSNATASFGKEYLNGNKGLLFHLAEAGHPVFGITFPNPQGNLYYQTEHLANAISIIKRKTGAEEVDVLGHSSGGLSIRMYLTGMKKSWGTSYRRDIRRVIFAGTPHLGIDFVFRHPLAFVQFREEGVPSPWDWWIQEGDLTDKNVFSGAFPLQLQMLNDLDALDLYPLKSVEPDWYTTYYGGQGFVSRSRGIFQGMKAGGNHMDKLMKQEFSGDARVYVLAGTDPFMKYRDEDGEIQKQRGEYQGTSDGIVFLKSARAVEHLRKLGANIAGGKTMDINHVELIFGDQAIRWITNTFSDTHTTNE